MQKCPNCGTEFEGRFCPECGEELKQSKKCPECGADCAGGVKFCPSCGYAFYGEKAKRVAAQASPEQPRPEQQAPVEQQLRPEKKERVFDEKTIGKFKKAYDILNNVPAILFLIFTVLTFCFFFAPLAVTPSLFGDEPGESLGNMYAIFAGSMPELEVRGCAIAAMFFTLLNLPITFLHLNLNFNRAMKFREIELFQLYKVRLKTIFEAVGWVQYFIFMIINAVIIGKLGAEGNLGMAMAGAGTILVLVFSIVFLVLSVAARLVDNLVILKNFPQFAEHREQPQPYEYTAEYPTKPEVVNEPLKAESALLKNKVMHKQVSSFYVAPKLSVFSIIFGIAWLIALEVIIPNISFGTDFISADSMYRLLLDCSAYVFVALVVVQSGLLFLRLRKHYVYKFYGKRNKLLPADKINIAGIGNDFRNIKTPLTVCTVLLFIELAAVTALTLYMGMMERWQESAPAQYVSKLIMSCAVSASVIISLIMCFIAVKNSNKAYKLLFGKKSPKNGTLTESEIEFVTKNEEFKQKIINRKTYLKLLKNYGARVRNYNFEKAMCAAGADYKDRSERIDFWAFNHLIIVAVAVFAVLVAIVLSVALPAALM